MKFQDEIEKRNKKLKDTTEKLTASQKKLEQAKKQLTIAQSKEAVQTAKLQQRKRDLTKQTKLEAREQLGLIGAYEKLSRKLTDVRAKYKNAAAQHGVNSRQAKQHKKQLDALNRSILKIDRAAGQSQRNVGNYASALGGIGRNLLGAFGVIGGVTLFASVIRGATRKIIEFDSAQSELAGILGTNKKNISDLTALTLDLGSTTAYTATQATKAATELAKLGFTQQEIKDSLEGTLDAAIAFGVELPEAASLVASTLKAFNLEAKDTQRVVSTLAVATTKTALDFSKLQTAMANVAPAAAAANLSIEQTTALLGLIVNKGIDASTAGTSLRNIFIELSASGKTLEGSLEEIANSQDKLSKANELFGKRNAVTAIALADSRNKVEGLTDAITGQDAALKNLVEERLDNLEGDLTLLSSAWEGFILSIEKGDGAFAKFSRSIIQGTTDLLGFLTESEKLSKSLIEEKNNLSLLIAEMQSSHTEESRRVQIKDELIAKYPNYLSFLEEENFSNEKLKEALKEINDLYSQRINVAVNNEKITDASKKYQEQLHDTNEELIKFRETVISIAKKQGIDVSLINFDQSPEEIAKQVAKLDNQLDSLGEGFNPYGLKFGGLSETDIINASTALNQANEDLREYSDELEKAKKNGSELNQIEVGLREETIRKNLTLSDAIEISKKYKDNQLLLSEAYQELTGNQNATTEEVESFKNLIDNANNTTFDSFIHNMAQADLSAVDLRQGIGNLAYSSESYQKAVEGLNSLIPEQERNTKMLEDAVRGLTAQEIEEKKNLIERIINVNQNISANDLLGNSLDLLKDKLKQLNKTQEPELNTRAGLKSKIQSLQEEFEVVEIGSERYKELQAEIKKYQNLLNPQKQSSTRRQTKTPERNTDRDRKKTREQQIKEEIKRQQEELEHYIFFQELKKKTDVETLAFFQMIEKKKIEILDNQLKNRLISQKKYEIEKEKIEQETDKAIKQAREEIDKARLEAMENELENYKFYNQSKIDEQIFLNQKLIDEELERVKFEQDLELNNLAFKLGLKRQEVEEKIKLGQDLTDAELEFANKKRESEKANAEYTKELQEQTVESFIESLDDLKNENDKNFETPEIQRVLFGDEKASNERIEQLNTELDAIDEQLKALSESDTDYTNQQNILLEEKAKRTKELNKENLKQLAINAALNVQSIEDIKNLLPALVKNITAEFALSLAASKEIPFLAKLALIPTISIIGNQLANILAFEKGTENAPEGLAWTQEKGAEIITDKHGNVKSFGSDKGAQLTYLEKGDKVKTAAKTKDILKSLTMMPINHGVNDFTIINPPQEKINYKKIGHEFERALAKKKDRQVIKTDAGYTEITYQGNNTHKKHYIEDFKPKATKLG